MLTRNVDSPCRDVTAEGISWKSALFAPAETYSAAAVALPGQTRPKINELYRFTIRFDDQGLVEDSEFEQFKGKQ